MKSRFLQIIACLLILLLIPTACIIPVFASEEQESEAKDFSSSEYLSQCEGFPTHEYFFDGDELWGGESYPNGARFTVSHPDKVGSVYIIFEYEYGPIQVTNNDTGEVRNMGTGAHLHQFLDMEGAFGTAPSSVTLEFVNGSVFINEVSFYTPGRVPDTVQRWEDPLDNKTDLILFSTHGDDEHLFFAGILPYYGVEKDYQVQVIYLTDHRGNGNYRMHEMLNGLWAIGMTTYPVFGEYDDFITADLQSAMYVFNSHGFSEEQMIGFVVEQLRRFKPQVIVTHDFAGEYGHSQHMAYAYIVSKALEATNDSEQYPELAEKYGTWDVPKAYFHLYKENPIVMDWDQPLDSYGGQTAFEVSIYTGFQQHKSQIWDFSWYYLGVDSAAQIPAYNPCEYGLFRSTVGPDVAKNDFFENLTTYAEQERLAEETRLAEEARLKKEEEMRLKAEEAARMEAERFAAAEAVRLEAERLAAEEAAKAATEQALLEQRQQIIRENILICGCIAAVLFVSICMSVVIRTHRTGKENRSKK